MNTAWIIVLYLSSAVAANMVVNTYGQSALPFTAFVLIPFDLTVRDTLHERWRGPSLWSRMAMLVAGGSVFSMLANPYSWRVAVASFVSFAAAGAADAFVYHGLSNRSRAWRMNASNAASAAVDSVVFPLVAFAVIVPALSIQQWAYKFVGGVAWVFILTRVTKTKRGQTC